MEELIKYNDQEKLLFGDVCSIIERARFRIAKYVNTEICMTYWQVGKRIKEDVLFNKRVEYGKKVIQNLTDRLNSQYGRGWGLKTLQHCVRAAYTFLEYEIVHALRRQLYWSHLRALCILKPNW